MNIIETLFPPVDYFSINSLIAFRNLSIDISEKEPLEKKAMAISKDCDYDVFRVTHHPSLELDDINTYHIDVLAKLFN